MQEFNQFIAEKFYYLFLGILMGYLVIRTKKGSSSYKKRRVLLALGIGVFLTYSTAILSLQEVLPPGVAPVFFGLIAIGEVYLLRRLWVFRRTCVCCEGKLNWGTILTDDRNTCLACIDRGEFASREEEGDG